MNIKALIPLGLFLLLCAIFGFGLTRDPGALPTEMLDKPFPDFEITTLYDETSYVTEDVLKGEISLVNIFGSWCASCVTEHPKLIEIGQQGNVQIIGVDWRDSREKGARWLKAYGDPYKVVLFDDSSQLAIGLGVGGAPESFLVGPDGIIRYKHVGVITDEVWDNIFTPIIRRLQSGI